MWTKDKRPSKMIVTADDMEERARPVARALVEHHEQLTGSRMAAYEGVAGWIGVSSSWLRKLIGRQDHIALHAHEYSNLVSVYRSVCERIEKAGRHEQAKAALIRGVTTDAIVASHLGMALRLTQSDESGTEKVILMMKIPDDPAFRSRLLDFVISETSARKS
jgi:hypothetical protein